MQQGKETLQSFEAIGYRPEALRIANPDYEGRLFTYYTFAGVYSPQVIDVWEVVGLRFQSNDPLLLDMRMMHIEDEMFEYEVTTLQDMPSYLSLDPDRLLAVIEFFEALLEGKKRTTPERISHFKHMSAEELRDIRLPEWKIQYYKGSSYRYYPDQGVQSEEKISVFKFPQWSAQYERNQVTTLAYDSFERRLLNDPAFKAFSSFAQTHGVGVVTFNQEALEEFIALLNEHTYENFVRVIHQQ